VGYRVTTLAEVHVAVADQLRQQLARATEINISPWPQSNAPLPFIEVWPGTNYVDYYGASDSDDATAPVTLRIRIATSTDPESGFQFMTDLLTWNGPSSIREALHADRQLGGVIDDLVVLTAEWDDDTEVGTHAAWVPVNIYVSKA
jgi:hypothetical protein